MAAYHRETFLVPILVLLEVREAVTLVKILGTEEARPAHLQDMVTKGWLTPDPGTESPGNLAVS